MENNKSKQKQHLIDMMKLDEEAGLYEEPKQHVELINDNIDEFDKAIELFKQETLEEAAERLYPLRNTFLERFKDLEQKIFIEGAKWQKQTTDEFAIGFVEWICRNDYNIQFYFQQDTMNELLEIYKKEL